MIVDMHCHFVPPDYFSLVKSRREYDVAEVSRTGDDIAISVRGTPFERRFRDIHTLSQQIQSREAHFETVGRILFNGDPDETFM